jgi:hypothetical protein
MSFGLTEILCALVDFSAISAVKSFAALYLGPTLVITNA